MKKSCVEAARTLVMILAAVLFGVATGTPALAADWTFMVYMGGDNNLSTGAVADVEEMRAATSSADVNVIVQVELSPMAQILLPSWAPGYNTYRLRIHDGAVDVVADLGNLDMGSPATLTDFIRWATAAYPARHNALTIWDHGSGWKDSGYKRILTKGAVQDETAGSYMSLADLGRGVRDAGVHLDILDFDACLMGMYEVAYEFRYLTDYLVVSEEVEPGDGNPYTAILNHLASDSGMDGEALAKTIVDDFAASYSGSRNTVTKSAVNMATIDQLDAKIRALGIALKDRLATDLPAIAGARSGAQHYYEEGNLDIVSLADGLSVLGGDVSARAAEVRDYITSSVVVRNGTYTSGYNEGGFIGGGQVNNSHGLAVFFPSAEVLREGEFVTYRGLSVSQGADSWAVFLEAFLNGAGGTVGSVSMGNGNFAYAIFWLDDNNLAGWTDVDLYVVEPDGTVGAPWIGESTKNGYFSADSADTGYSFEIYGAKDRVEQGTYLVVVNYYDDYVGPWYEWAANVYLAYMDPPNAVPTWAFNPGEYYKRMGLWNPAPARWNDRVIWNIINGVYSDWWVPGVMTRTPRAETFEALREALLNAKAVSDARRGKFTSRNLLRLFDYYNDPETP